MVETHQINLGFPDDDIIRRSRSSNTPETLPTPPSPPLTQKLSFSLSGRSSVSSLFRLYLKTKLFPPPSGPGFEYPQSYSLTALTQCCNPRCPFWEERRQAPALSPKTRPDDPTLLLPPRPATMSHVTGSRKPLCAQPRGTRPVSRGWAPPNRIPPSLGDATANHAPPAGAADH
ncbi:hypothetical protein ANANG_G00073360 [Anguilla anguilla]|uniref:Uncharacterized protein n=1 Tax=Anguilla anguilla TaxID=7936 RepID=A0A9D3MV38_ANGAN|nr:hypothetical protein ANANG_G00073360 [Anguilla anguilla]